MRYPINGKNGLPPPLVIKPDQPPSELARTLQTLRRRFGEEAVTRLSKLNPPEVAAISTGFPALDRALGVGGLPCGRIIDIYGPESSGKSTVCLKVIAAAQKQGGRGLLVDTEHAFEPAYARHCGVNLDVLYLAQPDTAETALKIVEAMVKAGIEVIAIDSAAALLPRAEAETDFGDHLVGLMGSLMSAALRKLVGPVRKHNTLLIFTNQLRQNAMTGRETSTGGRALRHYASVQLALEPGAAIREQRQIVGRRIRATVTKNRVAPPFRSATLEIRYG